MKKLLTLICIITMMAVLTACGAEKELTNTGMYEDWQLELQDAEVYTNEDGVQVVKVNAVYTNNSEEPQYALSSFAVRAFQDDTELTDLSDINGNEAALIQEVKNGQSLEVSYVFDFPTKKAFEVLIGTPTADQETIGKQVYFDSEE